MGKIAVIKTLINHILMSVTNPFELYCKKLDQCFSFSFGRVQLIGLKTVIINKYKDSENGINQMSS